MTDQEAMQYALALARQGWGRVHPNPMVGAVVLKDGALVGEGFHAEYGGPHAEVAALGQAGGRARGSTLVATLEPCVHLGKQPPCVSAITAAGVARVVVAMEDPNPEAGGGAEQLRSQGVLVDVGLCRDEAAALNAAFVHRYQDPARPFIALKLATSVDGRIADSGGNSRWISGAEAREFVQWLRAGFAAIGVGGATARLDDPGLTVRGSVEPRVPPRRVILTRSGNLEGVKQLLRPGDENPVMIGLVHQGKPVYLPREIEPDQVVEGDSLGEVLSGFRGKGIESMLIEGGGGLAGSLLEENLVDRYYWIQAPFWLGGGVPAYGSLPAAKLGQAGRWRAVERRALGSDTLLVLDRA